MSTMVKKIRRLLMAVGLVTISPGFANGPKIEIGQPFPKILLPSLEDGSPGSVADFLGKKLVLHIWASW